MASPSPGLSPSSHLHLALSALQRQGEHGAVSKLAVEHGVSRHAVYAVRERARAVLEGEFAVPDRLPSDSFQLTLTEADIKRTVIALRVETPASIRDEVAMLPVIYGMGWSFGKIQAVLVEAGRRASKLSAALDLSAIGCVALDEMYSQGRPVFAGIDVDTQYLFQLEVHETPSGEAWAASLGRLRDHQGLHPNCVVKDAGTGLAKGVGDAFPGIQENDDLFHAKRALGKVAQYLERGAYGAIANIDALEVRRAKNVDGPLDQRRSLGQQLAHARKQGEKAIDRFDRYDALRREAERVLELADRGSGHLRTSTEVVQVLERLVAEMMTLGGQHVRRVARFIHNRAKGLGRYLDVLARRLDEVTDKAGGVAVVEATVRAYEASLMHSSGGPLWDRRDREQELHLAAKLLVEVTEREPQNLWKAVSTVFPVLAQRHRASSVIENLNSVLRPHLVVQKSTSQSFLDLFRFYWNTRTRKGGPHKGSSAHELLTGERVQDWLTLLGYPPGEAMARAA